MGSFSDSTLDLTSGRLAALLQSRIATKIFYLIIVGIGCAAGRVFPFQRDFQGSREFLEHMFPGRAAVFYERADFLLTCVLGSILGTLIIQPASTHTALATGLGWPVIVRFLLEGMKATGHPPETRNRDSAPSSYRFTRAALLPERPGHHFRRQPLAPALHLELGPHLGRGRR
jgi:hypothetical protein